MASLDDITGVLQGVLEGLRNLTTLNKYGLAAVRIIKSRTRKGEFLEGASPGADEYSAGYKKKREKAGLPTHPVMLVFDDVEGMMSTIDHIVSADLKSVAVDITDPEKKRIATYHHVDGAGKSKVKRPFFDLSDEERIKIIELMASDLEVTINELISEVN